MPQPENLALELIEKEKREKTGFLDLTCCGLAEVPEAVRELVWLEGLSLGDIYINQEGDWLPSGNKAGSNTIARLPDWLSELSGLKTLLLDNTDLKDLSLLSGLTALQTLFLFNTQVADLSPLAGLSGLQTLHCSCTRVADLSSLSGLNRLQKLFFFSTQVVDLSPLTGLSELKRLNCSETQVADLSPLSGLAELKELDCSNTRVSDLSPFWYKIKDGWPVRWARYDLLSGVHVKDCPLIIPPVEFAIEGPEAVVEYFEQLGEDARPLNEVKVIFLGEGAAGKTSLIKRLRGEGFDPKESQTHGIRIQKTPFDIAGNTITAHCWDFGGQEVNQATHQFFLSQRCIYVVVLNSRSDDKAEKWLKHAASFGGRSPVLVVLNKIDENPSFEVDRKRLREKYSNIQDFFRLSCANGQGVSEFQKGLAGQIEEAPARRTPFPAAWLAVKDHFAEMAQDYIDSSQYRAVCEANGVTRRFSQDVLLQFLHDLGVVINFRNLKNFDTQILNPLWLTNGVYRIINSERVANAQGLLHEDEFDAVINDPRYSKVYVARTELAKSGMDGGMKPRIPQGSMRDTHSDLALHYPVDKLNYIVRVMQEFELCFRLDERRYVVPQLLPVSEPDFSVQGKGLRFTIRFPDLLPDSVFPRLMVKLHAFIQGELRWRTGMVLYKPSVFEASARVREDKEDREVQIEVCGQEPRRFLSFIRETVKEIVEGFANLPVTEWVPIPGCEEFFEYEYLVDAEKAGEKEVFIRQLKKRIPVADLLDGVEEPAMRDELAQTPVKAFVSYAHKDMEYLPELRAALSPLVRLNKLVLWDDQDIDAGEEWRKVIFQQLAEADLVLCLVSSHFIQSDFCWTQELAAALEAHNKNEKTVVPIRMRQCNWDDLPLAKIQGSPSDKWIASAKDKDAAWTEVSKSLEPAIQQAKMRKSRRKDAKTPD